jgi:hypothetical protein
MRVRYEAKGGQRLVRAALDDRASVPFLLDQRLLHVVVKPEVALAAGIAVETLDTTVTIPTAMGAAVVRVAKGRTLAFKGLEVRDVDVAVCEACVPAGAVAVLGAPFVARVEVTFDEATHEAVLTPKPNEKSVVVRPGLKLEERSRVTLEGFVNDLAVDESGTKVAIAMSESKAQRSRAVYEREKRGEQDPEKRSNAVVLIDVPSGKEAQRWTAHRGVVSAVALSPDGRAVASGGWDKRLLVVNAGENEVADAHDFGWSVRRIRWSQDGRIVAVAAWTPQNPLGDQRSKPAVVVYEVGRQ